MFRGTIDKFYDHLPLRKNNDIFQNSILIFSPGMTSCIVFKMLKDYKTFEYYWVTVVEILNSNNLFWDQ